MRVLFRITVAVAIGVYAPAAARAEHDHSHMHAPAASDETDKSTIDVGAGVVLARYETMLYQGDYQGVKPAGAWQRGRYDVSAQIGFYRITENGATYMGPSDLVIGPGVMLVRKPELQIHAGLPFSLPTGDHQKGFGMGHVMLMPAIAARSHHVTASLGFGQALGDSSAHQGHGTWPLIDPMNQQEITWSAAGSLPIARVLSIGARVSGGIAIGDGTNRVTAGGEAVWTEGRLSTTLSIFRGFADDPVRLGGGLTSAVSF